MNKVYIFLSILFLYSCTGRKIKSDLNNARIKGNVKTITEMVYSTNELDGKSKKNNLESKIIKRYDTKGNLLTENVYMKIQQKEFLYSQVVYKYDDRGNQVEINFIGLNDSIEGKQVCKYDTKGNRIEEEGYKADGKFGGKSILLYDDQGNLIKRQNLIINIESIINYMYDSKNNIIEENRYNSGDSLYMRIKYTYDEKNNQTSLNKYNPDKLIQSITYKYENFDKNENWLTKNEFY